MTKFAAFHDTRSFYINSLGYTKPLSYEEWAQKPESQKAALLFVQFYEPITLAWAKADSREFGDDSEGVSTVYQYLQKQISDVQYFQKSNPTKKATAEYRRLHPEDVAAVERRIIDEDPRKFNSKYIYRIAYNCLYCICGHDRKCDKDRMENETSSIVVYDGEELDLFDTISDNSGSAEDVFEEELRQTEFWSIIEDLGKPAEKVMRYMLSNDVSDLKALNVRAKNYKNDPLRDVEVSLDEVDSIVSRIRERFLDLPITSACGSYIASMLSRTADVELA